MEQTIVEQVTGWESSPFSGGYDGLRQLANDGFSGVVDVGRPWIFFLNGSIVAVIDGQLDDVEDVEGTTYAAPDDGLALVFAMRELGGERTARYYSEDTPLEEIDSTLSDGNFTGYVELSENVLSGNYYVGYYEGEAFPVAFVGNRPTVLTGEEAFERAADEVGIFKVLSMTIDVVELPSEPSGTGVAGGVVGAEVDESETGVPGSGETPGEDEDESGPGSEPVPGDEQLSEGTADSDSGTADSPPDRLRTDAESGSPESVSDSETGSEDETEGTDPTESTDPRFDGEAEWQETKTVPSLSPSESGSVDNEDVSAEPPSDGEEESADRRVAELEQTLQRREAELDELGQRLETAIAEREHAREKQAELEATIADLRNELERRTADREESEPEDDTGDERVEMTADDALRETNLFVRYGSKSMATLDAVSDGATADSVNENLQLDYHTQFDAESVSIDGQNFEDFLVQRPEYEFVEWLIRDFPYEIRDTNRVTELQDLFDALPAIDRANFGGEVTAQTDQGSVSATYDVVLRSKTGEPLVVSTINNERDPVTGATMEEFVTDTSAVAEGTPELAASVAVTASFYEPDALAVAAEVTGGGFLNRDARSSFVRTSRKKGYHLCLVEARRGSHHVTVPDL